MRAHPGKGSERNGAPGAGRGLAGIAIAMLAACGGDPGAAEVGALTIALDVGARAHDVAQIRIVAVGPGGGCDGAPLATKTIALGGPAGRVPAGGLFVLPPGAYTVCATPVAADGQPSRICARAQAQAAVVAGQTAEVLLVSQCQATTTGGLDVAVALNEPPAITGAAIAPSKLVTTCGTATLTITAVDPDGDPLTYGFTVTAGPPGATLAAQGPSAAFSAPTAGAYTVRATVGDARGASTALELPVRVVEETCAVPPAVQALFEQRCSPCHVAGASGGLKLDSAAASYANLVRRSSRAEACGSRTLVAPGDPAGSYLLAKLRGDPEICGAPMPRNRPPLPAAELEALEAWVAGLPR